MPQGVAHYADCQLDSIEWGPSMSYDVVVQEYQFLQMSEWDICPDIIEPPITIDNAEYMALHPFPCITILDEPAPLPIEEDDVVAHGRRQRREEVGEVEVEDVESGGD